MKRPSEFEPYCVGEALLELLAAVGIKELILNPGTDWAPILEGLRRLCSKGGGSF